MDKKTIGILVVLAVVILFYWQILEFLGIYTPQEPKPADQQTVDTLVTDTGTPGMPGDTQTASQQSPAGQPGATAVSEQPLRSAELSSDTTEATADTVYVTTQQYRVALSNIGGGPVKIELQQYSYRNGEPIEMIPGQAAATPEARFAGGTFSTSQLVFTCNKRPGKYDATRDTVEIVYTFTSANGATIERKYIFNPDRESYDMTLSVSDPAAFGFERFYDMIWNTPLDPTEPGLKDDYQSMEVVAMRGGSRENLDDYEDDQLQMRLDGQATWAGVRSKYFAAVLIPRNRPAEMVVANGYKKETLTPDGKKVEQRKLTGGLGMPFTSISPIADTFTVFVGGMDYMKMKEYGVGLHDMLGIGTTAFIGWLIKPFAIGVMWLLPQMYNVVGNYGLVIIIFALLVKIVTLPLSLKSFKSMQAMKDIQPQLEKLKEKYKKDPQKMNSETMKLYKQHGVNPISGCLPMLPQMPLFFAMFAVFRSTILLRNAPFVWFIDDLSRGATSFTDPYIVLVVLMILAQFVSQKFTMASTQQNKAFMYVMPLVFGFIFYSFSAGLVLYWTTFSILSLLDYVIFKRPRANQVQGPVAQG